jgi:3-dehydroquinate synthase
MYKYELLLDEKSCKIVVQAGLLQNSSVLVGLLPSASRYVIVTDSNVARLWGNDLLTMLQESGTVPCTMLVLEPGEQHKNLRTIEQLYHNLMELECDRDCLLIALGGGVVGDTAGFAAATWMRGVRYVQLPTSLLAMVDSGVGGKTAVNLRGRKNLIGAFHQPEAVLIDPELLTTLPRRDFVNGLPEVIKYGCVLDEELFIRLERAVPLLMQDLDYPLLTGIIARCVTLKADIVKDDEREAGQRMLLNFGHTVGHAIELISENAMLHGEAVASGMMAATALSTQMGMLETGEQQRIEMLLNSLSLSALSGQDCGELLKALRHDKKRIHGDQLWVLLAGIGQGVVRGELPEEEVRRCIRSLSINQQ